jgi:flagellar hook protein FlgE
MGFQQGLSGLNASSKSLEVIGNNIANANTIGAKASRAEFADVYANAHRRQQRIGIGVTVAAVAQQFTQGNISTTDNPLDIAINGNGFFEVQGRRGQLHAQRPVQGRPRRLHRQQPAAAPDGLPGRRDRTIIPGAAGRCRCRPAASRRRDDDDRHGDEPRRARRR